MKKTINPVNQLLNELNNIKQENIDANQNYFNTTQFVDLLKSRLVHVGEVIDIQNNTISRLSEIITD